MTPYAKFYVNLTKGVSRQIGEIYATNFVAIHMLFFFNAPTDQSP